MSGVDVPTEFVVEEVFPVSFRPNPIVWGTLESGTIRKDDVLELVRAGAVVGVGRVVTVEMTPDRLGRTNRFGIVLSGEVGRNIAVADRLRTPV